MLGQLVRWLVRLFFFAFLAGAVWFVVTRLMGGEDDDFEDFEDLEASFEFNETPVEIDVSGPATTEVSASGMEMTTLGEDAGSDRGDSSAYASGEALALEEQTAESGEASNTLRANTNGAAGGSRLIDIKGIGPGYESRLRAIGINSMSDLLNADPQRIAEQVGVIGGASQVEDWIEQARTILSEGRE